MESFLDFKFLLAKLGALKAWVFTDILALATLGQILAILLTFLVARLAEPGTKPWIEMVAKGRRYEAGLRKVASALAPLAVPVVWLVLQWLVVYVAARAGWPHHLNKIVVSLLTAWVIIRLTTTLVKDLAWAKTIAISVWIIAALNILNLLGPTVALLDSLSIGLGGVMISALSIIKGVFTLAILLWVATLLARILERRIKQFPNLTPSIRVLFTKLLRIVLITAAVIIAVDAVGIDLTAFALVGGAIGVGVGFGLQKVVSNLISGVILLLDRSIKPGDVVSVGDTYGWISSLGARYASVITRDGKEHLIPNENLITQEVINWSFTDNKVRLHVPIGISYEADVRKAICLCVEAAQEVRRVLKSPPPICLLYGFGESSVDLELRMWISDPEDGTSNVRSEVLLLIWDKFHAEGITIPFPQRDLHLKPDSEIGVHLHRAPTRRVPKRPTG